MPKTSLPRTDATPKQNEGHQRRKILQLSYFGSQHYTREVEGMASTCSYLIIISSVNLNTQVKEFKMKGKVLSSH